MKCTRNSNNGVIAALACATAAFVVACQDSPVGVKPGQPDAVASPVALAHITPTLPLTNTIVGSIDPCKAAGGTALASNAAVDRTVSGSNNRFRSEPGSWVAIWANADHDPVELTLDVSGSWNVVNGNAVSRSHLKIGGSDNVFVNATEYGERSVSGKAAFDLSGGSNCFGAQPARVLRNAPPAAPAGFPFRPVFDADSDGDVLEHFAPATALATGYAADGKYFYCLNSSTNVTAPLSCSGGKLTGSPQGTQMPTGLYYVAGDVDVNASDLQATVTIVAGGKVKVSGSVQTDFLPFHGGLLFATHYVVSPKSANTADANDAIEVAGSTSFFRGLIVAPNGRTTISGQQNSFTCPIMGDRVRLSGSNLYVSGEQCPPANLRIRVDPVTATNVVGDAHTYTATVETDASGSWQGVQGASVTFDLLNNAAGAAFIPPAANSCVTGAAGTCAVQINTATPGSVDVEASASATIDNFPLSASTAAAANTALGGTGNANKIYVDLRIRLSPLTATNAVGEAHQITATVAKNEGLGAGWVGVGADETVIFSLLNNTAGAAFVNDVGSCETDVNSQCSISINGSGAGSVDMQGSATVKVGGLDITRTTGTAQNTNAAGSLNASKVYVDLRISLTPLAATHALPAPDDVTAKVEQNLGVGDGWVEVGAGATVTFAMLNNDANAAFLNGVSSCVTDVNSECAVTITPANTGSVDIPGSTTVDVSGQSITRTTDTDANTAAAGSDNASMNWVGGGGGGATFLLIDEDGIDNGLRFVENPTLGVQNIFSTTTRRFSAAEVNADRAGSALRDVLGYFADPNNVGRNIALLSGQTGDEAWFAPNCIPNRWTAGGSGCAADASASFLDGIAAYFGGSVDQSLLDQIPDVRPLRALGLKDRIGELICAVVYDSDISINYGSSPPHLLGNLQGATLGVVAFTVLDVVQLNGFDSSSLPEVQVRIESASSCVPAKLVDAPIPQTSSLPADIDPANPPASGYRNR